jgi:glycosyltransferase involved in cell wall biosynthesis
MAQLDDITDPRVKLLSNPCNMGAGAARNTGLRAACADWVAFQDSDDEWLPHKLAKQMTRLASGSGEAVACYCGMAIVGTLEAAAGARTALRYIPNEALVQVEGNLLHQLLSRSFISTQMLVARRNALLEIGGFDESLPALEDWDCVIRLAQRGPFAFVDEPLVLQFFSENSITRSQEKRAQALATILEKHRDLLIADPRNLARHLVSLAGARRKLGDFAGSKRAISEALRLRPADPSILMRSAWSTLAAVLPGRRP